MFRRRYQGNKLFLEDLDIGRKRKVIFMEQIEEEQLENVRTISDVDFQRRFIVMESHLARLIELLDVVNSNNNN